jgi:hypothetical protein
MTWLFFRFEEPWGIAMYRYVYWSGVTLFVVWSVFSAVSALRGF